MIRRSKFYDIPNLDVELDEIVKSLIELTGKKSDTFPPVNQTPEMSRFIKKVSEGNYQEYIKIDGGFRLLGGGGSGGGFIEMRVSGGFIQWRDDPAGSWTNLIAIADLKGEPGPPGPPGTVADGDKGDITVSDSGATFTINPSKVVEGKIANNAVTEAKIKDNEVTEAKLKLADNTTGNVSISRHGFVPKLPNDANQFLNGVGNWVNIVTVITLFSIYSLGIDDIPLDVMDFTANTFQII